MPDENDIVYDTYGVDIIALLQALAEWIRSFFGFGKDPLDGASGASTLFDSLGFWWEIYSVIAILLSLLFLWGFIYAKIRFSQLSALEAEQLEEEERAWEDLYGEGTTPSHRWNDVETHIRSENPNDWRLAIIEADIMLGDALTQAGYAGVSIGDQLKQVSSTTMRTVQDAWDAHKVRNQIAHTGSDFVLTKRTAQEVIVKYERALRELGGI